MFTLALATLLAPGSTIYALDMNQQSLQQIPEEHNGVSIRAIFKDLSRS